MPTILEKISSATRTVFARRQKFRALTSAQHRAAADKWLAMILKSYVLKAAGESYNGQRWETRVPGSADDEHLLLIKTGRLYNAVKNSTVRIYRGKKGEWAFHAEVENNPYPRKGNQKPVTTKDVFLIHQYGTEKCPARPIFVTLSPEDQKELDDFVKDFWDKANKQ
jgi:hypothetical protein